jgi:hypothetical protein
MRHGHQAGLGRVPEMVVIARDPDPFPAATLKRPDDLPAVHAGTYRPHTPGSRRRTLWSSRDFPKPSQLGGERPPPRPGHQFLGAVQVIGRTRNAALLPKVLKLVRLSILTRGSPIRTEALHLRRDAALEAEALVASFALSTTLQSTQQI